MIRAAALAASLLFLSACGESGTTTSTTPEGGAGAGAGGAGGAASTPCTGEDDCFGDTSHCDVASGVCAGCAGDDDCRGSLKCDTAAGVCRDCVTDADCRPAAPVCDAVSGQCTAQCSTDVDCASTGGPSVCDTPRGVCVDCTGPGKPCAFCELDTYSCVGCLVDADCPPTFPLCGPAYECSSECHSDGDCPGELHCEPASLRCVECVTNLHCPGEICQASYTCG